jgi:hypothetical protein
LKNFKQFIIEKKELIDPFDEENWDEIENDITIFKIKIGKTLKNIEIIFYPAYTQIHNDNVITIRDDKYQKIFYNKLNKIKDNKNGIVVNGGNILILSNEFIEYDIIFNFVKTYLNFRKSKCIKQIEIINRLLQKIENPYDYDDDDDDDDDDDEYNNNLDKLNNDKKLNELLLSNINEFDISLNIKNLLKNFFKNY